MNLAGNNLLRDLYPKFEDSCTPAQFGRHCFEFIKTLPDFQPIWTEIVDILNPDSAPKNSKRLGGEVRHQAIGSFIERNLTLIYTGVFERINP
jgi:hypothetical protein